MLIISDGQWRWVPRRSVTCTAVWLTLCTQMIVTSPAAAATGPRERLAAKHSWGKTQMGVTAVVLPRCAIQVMTATVSRQSQPVEVRCTRDTDFGLSVASSSKAKLTIRTARNQQAGTNPTAVTGGEGTSRYVVERLQQADASTPAILSIDF